MSETPSRRALGLVLALVSTTIVVASAEGLAAAPHASGPQAAGIAGGGPAGSSSEKLSTAATPVVGLLAGFNVTTGGWNLSFPLTFVVPTGVSEVVYAWAVGGNFSAYYAPQLPSGMSVAASIGFEGMAMGNLTAGSYSSCLAYPGWTNIVSIAVYGIFGASNATYQFSSLLEPMQQVHTAEQVTLTLPAGGLEYLGVQSTGGTYPVTNSSLTLVDEQTAALRGGASGIIGRQSTNTVSFTTDAAGAGIVAVAIDSNASVSASPSVALLASFSVTTGGWDLSFPLPFFVPADLSQVMYLWAIGGNYSNATAPQLPTGMSVAASTGFEGIAVGNLSTGSYSCNLTYAGWTNIVSLAVYGISSGANTTYQFGALAQPNPQYPSSEQVSLKLPAGAAEYLGVQSTGGTFAVRNSSLTTADEAAWALAGGVTGLIGHQLSNVLSFSTNASDAGTVAVGIYSQASSDDPPVTFQEAGLPAGAHWTVAVDGSAWTSVQSSLTLAEPARASPYLIAGPSGYRVTGIAPSGTLSARGSPLTETFSFTKARTVSLEFREKGLAAGQRWCVELGGWSKCSSGGLATFSDLTPGTYVYAIVPSPLYSVSAKVGATAIPLQGSLAVLRSESVDLAYLYTCPVTFRESGLAPGTLWSITLKGTTFRSTNATIVVDLPLGTYAYKVGTVTGFSARISPSSVVVRGSPVTVGVTFRARA